MDVFPSEIWHRIAQFACVSGGRAVYSLSLTCRCLHEIAQEYILYSVSMTNFRQVIRFWTRVNSNCGFLDSHTPTEYMFLGCLNPILVSERSLNLRRDADLIRAYHALRRSDSSRRSSTDAASSLPLSATKIDCGILANAFHRIIEGVATTLTILHVHLTFTTRRSPLLEVIAPALEELTIYGGFKPPPPPPSQNSRQTSTAVYRFDSLKRVHLSQFPPLCITGLVAAIAPSLPALAQLYIPWQPFTTGSTTDILKTMSEQIDKGWKPRVARNMNVILEVDERMWRKGTTIVTVEMLRQSILDDPRIQIVHARGRWVDIYAAEKGWQERIVGAIVG